MKTYYVYIMANKNNTVLYTGVTNNLVRRVWEHKTKKDKQSFSAKYNLTKLVWYAHTSSIESAIEKEKKIKGGSRKKKITLIEKENPRWEDLSL